MSLSASLSTALTGLAATSKRAETVSSNVANASTPGYGRRVVELAGLVIGGQGAGVTVIDVRRETDRVLIGDRRLADAGLGAASTEAAGLARIEESIGIPDTPGALGDRINALDAALISAASLPESEVRHAGVLDAAKGLAGKLNQISGTIQTVRREADAAIAQDVGLLNDTLQRIEILNRQIVRVEATTGDTNSLQDQRQAAIDSIAAIVPLRQVDRLDGQVSLFTPGGAVLLDGSVREVSYTPTQLISPQMTLASGALSGLQIDGRPVSLGDRGPISGGRLAANFALRDEQAPAFQAQIDGLARDLVDRFQAADATLVPGAPGLFTDAGAPFDPLNESGLAARLSVNPLADPAQGGSLYRLRDGLGALLPGFAGDATGLQALSDALTNVGVPASTAFSGLARSTSGLAADILSGVARARVSAEADEGFVAARHDALRSRELEGGVDTDAEMASLLRVEQAFAANARVIQAVDEMLQILLRR